MKIGIVPAGGNSTRWNGYPKELLPVANGTTLLDRTIEAVSRVTDRIVLVTSEKKVGWQTDKLGDKVDYCINGSGLWSGIARIFYINAEWYYFAMPDTYYPKNAICDLRGGDFNIGYFETQKPERFGVLLDGQIHDKEHMEKGVYRAWGLLSWSQRVVNFWRKYEGEIETHTQAFNMAMEKFGYTQHPMDYYFDLASWKDYKELMAWLT